MSGHVSKCCSSGGQEDDETDMQSRRQCLLGGCKINLKSEIFYA
jgi:hypothetical protein